MRYLPVLIALMLGLTVLPLMASQNARADYTSGDYTYTLDGSNQATITGYTGAGGNITIPSTLDGYPVVAIGHPLGMQINIYGGAITGITANSVTTIYIGSFDNQPIMFLDVPNIINLAGFYGTDLTTFILPVSCKALGENAFYGCPMTSITLNDGLTTIGNRALTNTLITDLKIPDSVISFNVSYFATLTDLKLGSGLTSILDGQFGYCNLASVTIPSGITYIGNSSFEGDCPFMSGQSNYLSSIYFMGNSSPSVGEFWIDDGNESSPSVPIPGLVGHAYATSNFPAPGEYFHGLLMGDYIPYGGGGAIAPVAAFSANHVSGAPGLSVHFTDSSTNTPTNWTWSFGDGSVSYVQNPTHVYAVVGNYTVSLLANNSAGQSYENKTAYIKIANPAPLLPSTPLTTNQIILLLVMLTMSIVFTVLYYRDPRTGILAGMLWLLTGLFAFQALTPVLLLISIIPGAYYLIAGVSEW